MTEDILLRKDVCLPLMRELREVFDKHPEVVMAEAKIAALGAIEMSWSMHDPDNCAEFAERANSTFRERMR